MDYTYFTFEEFLQNRFVQEHPEVYKDQIEDAFDRWLQELDGNEYIALGEEFGIALLVQAKRLHKETVNT